MTKTRIFWAVIGVSLLVSLVAVPVAGAAGNATGSAVIEDIDLSEFPRVSMDVVVPGALLANGETPVFSVKENGESVEVLNASVKATAQPIDAVLVVDSSGSMSGPAIAAAKSAAKAFIAELKAPSRASVVAFADRPRVVLPMTSDAEQLNRAIDRIEPSGETALYDAVLVAIRQVARSKGAQPVVIVLSDGGDTMSRTPMASALAQVKRSRIPVLAVALRSDEADPRALRILARQNGGRVATVRHVASLTGYYQALARELQTSYRVAYNSRRPATMDLDIAVNVKTAAGKAAVSMVVDNPLAAQTGPLASTIKPLAPANPLTYGTAVLFVFFAVGLLVVALTLMLVRPKTGLEQLPFYDQAESGETEAGSGERARVMSGVMGAVEYVAGKGGFKLLAYEQLDRAGLPLRPTEYIGLHFGVVLASGLLAGLLLRNLPIALIVVAFATIIPIVWISWRVRKRRERFDEQLPDTLDLLAGSLRAGWGIQQAIEVIVEQSKPPMSDEFRRAETEARLGRSVEQALESISLRMHSADFSWVVSAISIQREVGGNLAELLTIVANTIRDRNAVKRQVRALTAEGRLSAGILIALPFLEAGLLFFTNRPYISKLFTTAPGLMLTLTGAVLMIVGSVWLNKVIRVEV